MLQCTLVSTHPVCTSYTCICGTSCCRPKLQIAINWWFYLVVVGFTGSICWKEIVLGLQRVGSDYMRSIAATAMFVASVFVVQVQSEGNGQCNRIDKAGGMGRTVE